MVYANFVFKAQANRLKHLSLFLKLIDNFQLFVCIGLCSRMVDHFLGSDNTSKLYLDWTIISAC